MKSFGLVLLLGAVACHGRAAGLLMGLGGCSVKQTHLGSGVIVGVLVSPSLL